MKTMRTCSLCGTEYIGDNRNKYCGSLQDKTGCAYKRRQETAKEFRLRNLDTFAMYSREYRKNSPDNVKKTKRKHYIDKSDYIKEQSLKYYYEHPEQEKRRRYEYQRNKLVIDPYFRLVHNLRGRMNHALNGNIKVAKSLELLGCTGEELAKHLQSQFQGGMTLDNHGKWHIDHIKPCSAFDLSDPEQQKQCFHYTNLQPLWAEDNLRKGGI